MGEVEGAVVMGGIRLILTWMRRTAEAIRQLEKLKLTTHFIVITGWCN